MIQILHDTKIPFMKYRKYFYAFSGSVLLATVVWLVAHGGPRYSVDFTGGTLFQVKTAKVLHPDDVRKALDAAGYKGYELQAAGTGDELNDTSVGLDRIRERSKQLHKLSHEEMMNTAMNETLSRTIITSLTVFLAVLSLYLFGGEVINDFALCMLAGVIFGTYSSIY